MPYLLYVLGMLLTIVVVYHIYRSLSYTLPKIVWSYWEKDIPPLIQTILDDRARNLPGWKHIHLDGVTCRDYIHIPFPSRYNTLSPAHKADWIRLALLLQYGGCWMDCGIIVNRQEELDDMYRNSWASMSDCTGFYLEKLLYQHNITTYIENWFLMAPARSRFLHAVMKEYSAAIDIGFEAYKTYAEHLPCPVHHIYSLFGTYLTQHVCIQVALHKVHPTILLYRAEDSMMKLNKECDFQSRCVMETLRDDRSVRRRIPFMKLTSGERGTNIDITSYFHSNSTSL